METIDNPQPNESVEPGELERCDAALLSALVCGANAKQAAKKAGVHPSTAYRRLNDTEFKRKLDEMRNEIVSSSTNYLAHALTASTRELVLLLKDKQANIRLKAANSIIDQFTKLRTLVGMELKMTEMEATLNRLDKKEVP